MFAKDTLLIPTRAMPPIGCAGAAARSCKSTIPPHRMFGRVTCCCRRVCLQVESKHTVHGAALHLQVRPILTGALSLYLAKNCKGGLAHQRALLNRHQGVQRPGYDSGALTFFMYNAWAADWGGRCADCCVAAGFNATRCHLLQPLSKLFECLLAAGQGPPACTSRPCGLQGKYSTLAGMILRSTGGCLAARLALCDFPSLLSRVEYSMLAGLKLA